MKKLITAILFVLSTHAHAQIVELNKKMLCSSLENIVNIIVNSNEKILWQGRDIDNGNIISVFVNKRDKSWTVLESNKDIGCILAIGEEFEIKWQDFLDRTTL